MRIPSRFSLGGLEWTVRYKNLKSQGVQGLCHFSDCRVEIHIGLRKDMKEQVFLHELMHAVLYTVGSPEYRNEQLVDTTAHALLQVAKTSRYS